MRTKFLVWVLVYLILLPAFSLSQIKPQIPTRVKSSTVGKTYWDAEVEDILFSKDPQEGQILSVGVRVKFRIKINQSARDQKPGGLNFPPIIGQ